MEKSASHAMVPCGHQALCEGCAAHWRPLGMRDDCPVCRARIDSIIKIFVAAPIKDGGKPDRSTVEAPDNVNPDAGPSNSHSSTEQAPAEAPPSEPLLHQLIEMGFNEEDCRAVLASVGNDPDSA